MQNTVASTTDDLWFMNTHVRVALAKSGNNEGISLLEHTLPYGDAPPLHVHEDEDELFYLLEGEMIFRVGDHAFTAKAGDAFVAPCKQPHGFRVVSPEGARLLTITRGGFESTVRSASRPALARRLPEPIEPTLEMQNALGSICAANRIELVGPPLTA
jgi:mannose-6-phosphate isomerase-like protein (cupin superfamily)